jgi:hypothetical protein
MDPGDLVRVWSPAGFVYAFELISDTYWKSPNLVSGTLGLYVGPNPRESKRLGQPMVDIVVGEKNYSIDRRFLDVVLV